MKIKMSEVIAQRDSLKSSISQTKSQLSSAKKKLKSAANSEALKGDVKDAIDNKITNYQVPLLTNYVNSLDVISQGYDNLISTFKSIVSENSDSAIIDTDVLQQMVDKFDSPLEQLKTSSNAINKAIDDVADIVTLTKVTTDDAISEFRGAKKVLTNTIKDMGTFNNTVFTSEAGDILDEQNTQIGSLSNLGSSSYTSKKAKDFYKKTAFKTEVKETKLVVSGKARRDQLKNELAKNLYDSKYSGYMVEQTRLEATVGSITAPYLVGKKYYKTAKKWATSAYAEYRFSEDRLGNTIIKKSEKTVDRVLDFVFGTSKTLKKKKSHSIVQYHGNKTVTKSFEKMMKTLGETDYSKEVRKSLKTIEKDGLKGVAKAKEIAKGVVRGTKSNVISEAEEAFNTKTLKNVIKATKKSGRITKGVKTAFKESNVGTALKTGSKFAKGVAVLNVVDGVVETFGNVEKNKTQAKRQGLHGAEVSASVATGFVVDAAKATVKGVASTAAATAGAAAVGAFATGVLGLTAAPVLVTGIVAVGAAIFVSNRIDKIDKSTNLTNNVKSKVNSFIKGCGDFVKGMKGWKSWT
ncbi:T7SS effector LXG polymorphic toxin [Streptococcus ruminicola]|nr:T7SS effector LXG polymorphic toxin [Streptococcus ruminicola]